jgi:arylsulfatase A-like enzyme/Tfp pilus assembly protein PilF
MMRNVIAAPPVRRLLSILCLLAAATSGCGPRGSGRASVPRGAPIVLISIDTLRSDHLPAYGYRAVATPAIDSLRRDSILFERAFSHAPLTLPSHVSLLTGLVPSEHGVRDNLGYDLDAQHVPLLQGSLQSLGYATGAAVSAYVLRGSTGLATHFDTYEDGIDVTRQESVAELQRPGAATVALAIAWLRTVKDRPFFLFVHLYEPHTPYSPPEPFASRFASPYDGEIAASDDLVGRLLQEMKTLDLYDRSVVILLSDHGEGLGDHGEEEHGIFLYRSTLQVPLILKLPRGDRAGSTVAAPAQLIDVYPTLMALLGVRPPGSLKGANLLALEPGAAPRPIYSETFYPRLHLGWSDLASIILDRHHYIQAPEPELYDLAQDPAESRNVLAGQDALAEELRASLTSFKRDLGPPTAVDQETRAKLSALGYVGGSGSVLEGDLPDPKSQKDLLRDLRVALRAYGKREYAEAIPLLRKVLDRSPMILDAWEALARSLEAVGKDSEALDTYRAALRISSGSPQLALPAATLFLRGGRLEEAKRHAELAVVSDPVASRVILAQVALRERNLGEAEIQARKAVAERGSRLAPLLVLGEVLYAEKRPREAWECTERAAAELASTQRKDPSVARGLYLLRGRILADQGEAEKAVDSFLREIEMFPAETPAYTHLAVLYFIVKDPVKGDGVLRRMIASNPTPRAYVEAVRTLRVVRQPAAANRFLREGLARYPADPALREMSHG